MIVKTWFFILPLLFLLVTINIVSADDFTPKEIVEKSIKILKGETAHGEFSITISSSGRERMLNVIYWEMGNEYSLARITSPVKEKGISTLKRENNLWNYFPKINRVVRIPSSTLTTSWMGTDFTYNDIVNERSIIDDYDHKILQIYNENDLSYYEIECIPKQDASVVWGKIVLHIRKDNFINTNRQYYDEKNRLIKELIISDIRKIKNRIFPFNWTMRSNTDERESVLIFSKIEFNIKMDEDIFSLRNLRKK